MKLKDIMETKITIIKDGFTQIVLLIIYISTLILLIISLICFAVTIAIKKYKRPSFESLGDEKYHAKPKDIMASSMIELYCKNAKDNIKSNDRKTTLYSIGIVCWIMAVVFTASSTIYGQLV